MPSEITIVAKIESIDDPWFQQDGTTNHISTARSWTYFTTSW